MLDLTGIGKRFGGLTALQGISFKVGKGSITGIIGPNGAGKTTLFRMITGQEKPDSGDIRLGQTVKLAHLEQDRDVLDPKKSVWEMVSGGYDTISIGGRDINSRAYVSKFNFAGPDQQKTVGMLSGGERNRLHLALMLKKEANVLLLDEPTNDLDVNTMRALEEALENFAGCAVVISHDRWFLDRIATHILAFEGDSQVVWFEGNYSEYEKDLKRRTGNTLTVPRRIRYRQLTR